MLALWDQILALVTDFRRDLDLALALGVLAKRNLAVDLRDNRKFLGLARLEQLRDSRQPPGDVLGLGRFARNLRDDVAGIHMRAFRHVDISANRQVVARDLLAMRNFGGLAGLV